MTDTMQSPAPGQFFEIPGVAGGGTQKYWQYEPTQALAAVPSGVAQVTVNGIQQFTQTDVVLEWLMEVNVAGTWTTGGSGVQASPYAPYNLLGPIQITIQNQYSPVNVESGIDLYIFNIIRNRHRGANRDILGANPAGAPVGVVGTPNPGYYTTTLAQPNLVVKAPFAPTTATPYTGALFFRIPASTMFDVYSDLSGSTSANVAGNQGAIYHHCYVSPQYMGGTVRNVIPKVKFNTAAAIAADQSPIFSGTIPTYSDQGTNLTFRRYAVYNNNDPAVLPPQFAWQTTISTTRLPFNGVSKATFLMPNDSGQILSCYVRMWDPLGTTLAQAGSGAPIAVSALTNISFTYATGVYYFTGTALEWQQYWLDVSGGVLLPQGVFAFDFARDDNDLVTNLNCPNTLTTSTIQIQVTTAAPTSAQAYAVLGVESLALVSVS